MKIKTSELSGVALDWAVAKCEYPELIWGETIGLSAHIQELIVIPQFKEPKCWWCPSTDWAQGGPIIEREKITIFRTGKDWMGYIQEDTEYLRVLSSFGPTPLIAAMRCYVASKLGDEVEIPEELK